MKKSCILGCIVLCLSLFIGCQAKLVQNSSGEMNTVTSSADVICAAQPSAADLKRPEVTISGMTFTVNSKTYDLNKLERSANAIIQCDYITDTVFLLECHISPNMSFYALFNAAAMDYANTFYGTNCTWKDNDISSILYAFDNTVCDAAGQKLYTVDMTETQDIYKLELSQDGKTATVFVRDINSAENDVKTYSFERQTQ